MEIGRRGDATKKMVVRTVLTILIDHRDRADAVVGIAVVPTECAGVEVCIAVVMVKER